MNYSDTRLVSQPVEWPYDVTKPVLHSQYAPIR